MQSQKIVLIVNYPPDRQQSMIRFGAALASALRTLNMPITCWTPPQFFRAANGQRRYGSVSKWLGYADKFLFGAISLAWLRIRNPGAVWHIVDHGNAMYTYFLPRRRVVVTCHDCIAIEEAFHGRTGETVGRFGKLFQRLIVGGLQSAGLVAAVSKATLEDLRRLTQVTNDRTIVVHNGLLQSYQALSKDEAAIRLKKSSIPQDLPFIFMIGSNLKRKNRLGAIRSFESFRRLYPDQPMRLIIAGEMWSDDIRQAANESDFKDEIVEASNLSDDVLHAAYCKAALVTFPSLAEGFGLPVIEAQACGALVVASNIEPMPEVGGDGALYADPNSPAEYAATMARALQMDGDLRTKALENVKRFSTQGWAQAYAAAYAGLSK